MLVVQLSQGAVPVTVAQLDGTGETTTVAVLVRGSITVTVELSTTKILVVLLVKTVVLVTQSEHSVVAVAVEYPGDSSEMTTTSVVSKGCVIVTVLLPTTVVFVVLVVKTVVLILHSEHTSGVVVYPGSKGETTKVSVVSQGSVIVTVVPPMKVVFVVLVV